MVSAAHRGRSGQLPALSSMLRFARPAAGAFARFPTLVWLVRMAFGLFMPAAAVEPIKKI